MHVALVHDWLTGMRGGERGFEVFCELFPNADLVTLLHLPGSVSPIIQRRRIITSFIQRLPDASRRYRYYLPLFPAAIGRFDFRDYDLVLSSSHCVAKGVHPAPRHACYCFTPSATCGTCMANTSAASPARPREPSCRRWRRRCAGVTGGPVCVHDFVRASH